MTKNIDHLGVAIRVHRRARGLSQQALGQLCRLDRLTIAGIEGGAGNLSSFLAVLEALGMGIGGLPEGKTLGDRIAALRRSTGISQRRLAELCRVSHPTIVALEVRTAGRLDTLLCATKKLGSTIRLVIDPVNAAQVIHGRSEIILTAFPSNHFDGVITDPPYMTTFDWWAAPTIEVWKEIARMMKPGAFLAAFTASRTYHRMASLIEQGGLEVHDGIGVVKATAMPKGKRLKGLLDMIVLARKPLTESSMESNIQRWGTGRLQLDAARIADGAKMPASYGNKRSTVTGWGRHRAPYFLARRHMLVPYKPHPDGRYPANVIGDIPEIDGYIFAPRPTEAERHFGLEPGENEHPTIKSVELMRYICRMITPPSGLILDPFAGSGSTGIAAVMEGFRFVGVEQDTSYAAIAERRIGAWGRRMMVDAAD